jgi:SatD family (SatD)
MPAVITIDQRSSRKTENRAVEWAHRLNRRFGPSLILPFAPTIGDEIQAVTSDPEVPVEIVLQGVRDRSWWLGLGLGQVETPLADSAAQSRGPAFYDAREAVEKAKTSLYGFAVRATDPETAEDVQAVFELLGFVIRKRGEDPKRWRAVELAQSGISTVRIGEELGVSQQAASKRLRTAGVDEEIAGRRLAIRLISRSMGPR